MKFDDLLRDIGECGWYQKRVYLLAVAPTLLLAFETMSVIFIFYIPEHRCAVPGFPSDTYQPQDANHSLLINRSIPLTDGQWDTCNVYVDPPGTDVIVNDTSSINGNASYDVTTRVQTRCGRWVYDDSLFESTIATDFDVVCGRNVVRATSNMVSEVGCLVGTLFMGFVSDRFGRKLPFFLGGLALIGGGFGIAFSYNLILLNFCRFILGIARMALFVNGIVIGMEIVGPSKRAMAGVLIEFVWCLGEFLLVPFVYLIRDWRHLEIALSIPSVVLLAYWWLIPESPRWLVSRGRDDQARQVLQRIATSNGTQLPPMEDCKDLLTGEDHLNFRFALKSKELVIRVVLFLCSMFVIVLVYYGVTLNITNLSGNVFTNFTLGVVAETLAYVVAITLVDRIGRKPLFTVSMLVAGTACSISFLPVVLGAPAWTVVGLAMLGRFAVCIAFAVIYVYGAELFPTVVRSSAMGVGVTCSRFGGILAPYLADVGLLVGGKFRDALPLIVMGSPALVVGLMSLWLPETLHTKLPETLEDLELNKIKRGFLCCTRTTQNDDYEMTVNGEEKVKLNGEEKTKNGDGKVSNNC